MSSEQAYSETPFGSSHSLFEALTTLLSSGTSASMTHSELEDLVREDGNAVLRQLLQDHLDLRAKKEERQSAIEGSDGVRRTHARGRSRVLNTVFGKVKVQRLAYSRRDSSSLCPMDAELNLPVTQYSDGLRRCVAEESSRGSFDEAVQAIGRTTATTVPKRQAEGLASIAAGHFDAFYAQRKVDAVETTLDPLILTVDGKGIIMRRQDLSPETKKAADRIAKQRRWKPRSEKDGGRRRMATVASVYSVARHVRTPEDVMGELRGGTPTETKPKRPLATNKRVWASIAKPAKLVIEDVFEEARRRDPDLRRKWVVLVDGNEKQIERILEAAKSQGVEVTIVLDFIHVLQYLWKAGNALCGTGTPDAEKWVCHRATRLLQGSVSGVAAGIRRSATLRGLKGTSRKAVDKCASYLLKYRSMIRYDECLKEGYPIASGVIEGACRHLIKDRLDITGARWSLDGAEAILRLRSLRASGDFDKYWRFHQLQRLHENHLRHYAGAKLRLAG